MKPDMQAIKDRVDKAKKIQRGRYIWAGYFNGQCREEVIVVAHCMISDNDALLVYTAELETENKRLKEAKSKVGAALYKAAKLLSDGGYCTHYPGYTCDKGFPAACPECIKKSLLKGEQA